MEKIRLQFTVFQFIDPDGSLTEDRIGYCLFEIDNIENAVFNKEFGSIEDLRTLITKDNVIEHIREFWCDTDWAINSINEHQGVYFNQEWVPLTSKVDGTIAIWQTHRQGRSVLTTF